ncbi:MAG: amino acid deaminase/aldolase [Nakamurella sp.]
MNASTGNGITAITTAPQPTPIDQLRRAVAHLDPPFGVLDDSALTANALDMVRRAGNKSIRLATKSVRIRSLISRIVGVPGFAGLLAYTLPEALWLHAPHSGGTAGDHGFDNIVIGYPTVHRQAIAALAASESAAAAITLMVDDPAQLDLIDSIGAPGSRPEIRVCLELDAAYRPAPGVHLGALRSPLHSAKDARRMAEYVHHRKGFRLVGMMAYEGQIAGVGNAGGGPRQAAVRVMQRRSAAELAQRRATVIAAVSEVAELEFVNGGGTGSLEITTREDAVTELAAGSGLLGPGLFDLYHNFQPGPAAFFVLPVVRRPDRRTVTLLGGGWIASGPPGEFRQPTLADPAGLHYIGDEGAGEVQTPLRGRPARRLSIGDTVWLRHAKAGELAEHLNEVQLVRRGKVDEVLNTYRGDGQAFL